METVRLSGRFSHALLYATAVHHGDVRKGTTIPYVSHLLAVCALVLEHGGDEDEAIAGLLHDTLEDHPEVTREMLRRCFGERVANIVQSCSDVPCGWRGGKKPSWKKRKRAYVERIRRRGSTFVRVALADKLHNVRAILADYRTLGDKLWSRFNAKKGAQLRYFSELQNAFRQARAPERMRKEFSQVVSELDRLARSTTRSWHKKSMATRGGWWSR